MPAAEWLTRAARAACARAPACATTPRQVTWWTTGEARASCGLDRRDRAPRGRPQDRAIRGEPCVAHGRPLIRGAGRQRRGGELPRMIRPLEHGHDVGG